MTIYSDGADISFEDSTINILQILGDGENIAIEKGPVSYTHLTLPTTGVV